MSDEQLSKDEAASLLRRELLELEGLGLEYSVIEGLKQSQMHYKELGENLTLRQIYDLETDSEGDAEGEDAEEEVVGPQAGAKTLKEAMNWGLLAQLTLADEELKTKPKKEE